MNDLREQPILPDTPDVELPVQPSWKPLLWSGTILAAVIGLGELFLELGVHVVDALLHVIETLYLALIEAPEELLEDQIEEWLGAHFPHDADRYSEIVTAVGLTPVKIIIGIFLVRWLWRVTHGKLIPRFARWCRRQYQAVVLAWRLLAWPYKALIGIVAIGSLFILI